MSSSLGLHLFAVSMDMVIITEENKNLKKTHKIYETNLTDNINGNIFKTHKIKVSIEFIQII